MIGSTLVQNRYTLYLFFFLLTGCAQPHYIAAKCPAPTIPPEPHYPIADLKEGDKPSTVVKAYASTVHLQRGYIGELQRILEGYRDG